MPRHHRPINYKMRTFLSLLALILPILATTSSPPLILRVPPHISALPPNTHAILTTKNHTLKAPVTRANTFTFTGNLIPPYPSPSTGENTKTKVSYLLDIACRDYDFMSYGLDVEEDGNTEIYRVARGGAEIGGREVVGEGGVELRVLRVRDYYEQRPGCECILKEPYTMNKAKIVVIRTDMNHAQVSPLDLLKNPMILIGVVGLAFVVGMPYLMDNSTFTLFTLFSSFNISVVPCLTVSVQSVDPEMKKEFEEQQKKSILRGGASTANPLQNFDMAAWMAGKTAGSAEATENEEQSTSAPKARRRG